MTRPAAASLSLEPIAPRESRDVDSLKPGASMCLPAYRVWRWFIVPGLALWLSSGGAEALTAYHVGPTASGLGDGSSVDNAAQYADAAFWSMVETVLETDEVTVRFAASSDYGSNTNTRPALSFRNFGNPLKRLTLSGVSRESVVWSHSSISDEQKYFIKLEGAQNISIEKMTFTGNVLDWAVSLTPNTKKPTRNITIEECTFSNLLSVVYGAVGVSDATRDVRIAGCSFAGVGVASTSHMIYGSEACRVSVENCSFVNCVDTYLKIRKDSDYWVVTNCVFASTAIAYDHPFLDICTLNSTDNPYDPLDPMEYFGDHMQVTDCSFTAASLGSSVDAVQFRGAGYDAYGFYENGIRLDAVEGSTLETGTTPAKLDVLWDNLGIRGERVIMYGNTFSRIRHPESYVYELAWNSTSAGWVGHADIQDTCTQTPGAALTAPPIITNGDFEKRGYPSRYWRYNHQNDLIPAPHAGLNGTATAIFLDRNFSPHQIWQWLYSAGTRWQADFCLALGAFAGTGEKFRVDLVHNEIGDQKISLAVNDLGQIGIYQNSNWRTLTNLGTIGFSIDGNGDGDYGDGGDTLRWYHLRITGDYSSTPCAAVQISDANSYALNPGKLENMLASWVNGAPVAGASSPGSIVFVATACDAIVDEVQITNFAPATLTHVWTGAGADNNWSTSGNWAQGAPGSGASILFTNTDGAPPPSTLPNLGTVNNIVDANLTVNSLTYLQTNVWHVTQIPSGITLTLNGAGYPLLAGTTSSTLAYGFSTIEGQGRLVVDSAGGLISIRVGKISSSGGGGSAILDLAGLNTFTANISRLLVGAEGTSALERPGGVLYLAKTNLVASPNSSASALLIGDAASYGSGQTNSVIYMGTTNAFFVNSGITVGGRRSTGWLKFLSGSGSVAYFRDYAGSGRQNSWYIGDNSVTGNTSPAVGCTGLADFSAGTVDAMVGTIYVGRRQTAGAGTGAGNGTLIIGAGCVDANAVEIGYQQAAGASAGIGRLVTTGGPTVTNLIVNNYVRLGNLTGGASGGAATNSFSIGSAVMVHGNIVSGGASANIVNLTNGFLYAGGKIGSVSGTNDGPLYALNIHSGSITLDLGASGNGATPVCSVSNLWINTLTLNVKGTGLSEGVVPLIKCYGMGPTGNGFRGITPGTLAVNFVGSFSNSTDTLFLVMSSRPRIAAASRLPNGSVVITGAGVPATTYRVLASEDLGVPIGRWSQAGTVTALGDGTYNFTDTTGASYSRRFYQLVRP